MSLNRTAILFYRKSLLRRFSVLVESYLPYKALKSFQRAPFSQRSDPGYSDRNKKNPCDEYKKILDKRRKEKELQEEAVRSKKDAEKLRTIENKCINYELKTIEREVKSLSKNNKELRDELMRCVSWGIKKACKRSALRKLRHEKKLHEQSTMLAKKAQIKNILKQCESKGKCEKIDQKQKSSKKKNQNKTHKKDVRSVKKKVKDQIVKSSKVQNVVRNNGISRNYSKSKRARKITNPYLIELEKCIENEWEYLCKIKSSFTKNEQERLNEAYNCLADQFRTMCKKKVLKKICKQSGSALNRNQVSRKKNSLKVKAKKPRKKLSKEARNTIREEEALIKHEVKNVKKYCLKRMREDAEIIKKCDEENLKKLCEEKRKQREKEDLKRKREQEQIRELQAMKKKSEEQKRRKKWEAIALKKKCKEEALKKRCEEQFLVEKEKEEAVKKQQIEARKKIQREAALMKKKKEEELKRKHEEALKKKKKEMALKKKQEECLKKKQEEALKRKHEEALKTKQKEEALKKKQEEEALKKKQEEDARKKKIEEDALYRKCKEEFRKEQSEEEALKKQCEERDLKKKQREETLRKKREKLALLRKCNELLKKRKENTIKNSLKQENQRKERALLNKSKQDERMKKWEKLAAEKKMEEKNLRKVREEKALRKLCEEKKKRKAKDLKQKKLQEALNEKNKKFRLSLLKPLIQQDCQPGSKVSIVGTGATGMACAITLLSKGITNNVTLYDTKKDLCDAEHMDLMHGSLFLDSLHINKGTSIKCTQNSRVVIVTAGVRPKPEESSLQVAQQSADIIKQIMPELVKQSPKAIFLIVANPADVMTWLARKITNLPVERCFSPGCHLDTARFRMFIAKMLGVSTQAVHGYIIGEHGPSSVPLWSTVTVGGTPLNTILPDIGTNQDPMHWSDVHKEVIKTARKVSKVKGYTNWAIGLTVTDIVSAIFEDSNRIMSLSTNAEGMCDIKDEICLSLPSIVNKCGLCGVIHPRLSDWERDMLQKSANILLEAQCKIKL